MICLEYKPVELDPEEQVVSNNNPYAQEDFVDNSVPTEQVINAVEQNDQITAVEEESKTESNAITTPVLNESEQAKLKMLQDISQATNAEE